MMVPDGRENPRIKLWEVDARPGTTVAGLETHYLAALDGVDKVVGHKAVAIRSGRFTEDGANAEARQFAWANNIKPD
jgi:hypothetical protein